MPHPRAKARSYKEITLQQLRSFGETARLGSLAAAAKSLGLTHPTVREQVLSLERDFQVTLAEQGEEWRLTLIPRDPGLGRHLGSIDVYGAGDRPRCIEAVEGDGDAAFTLLDEASDGAAAPTRPQLEERCRPSSGAAGSKPR